MNFEIFSNYMSRSIEEVIDSRFVPFPLSKSVYKVYVAYVVHG